MDGFHLANVALAALGRADRKGAPRHLRRGRLRRAARPAASRRPATRSGRRPTTARSRSRSPGPSRCPPEDRGRRHRGQLPARRRTAPWDAVRDLLDEVWAVRVDPDLRTARLVARHVEFGKPPERAAAWVASVDEGNAELVRSTLHRADLDGRAPELGLSAAHTMRGVSEARFGSLVARGVARGQPRRRRPHERLLGRRPHLRGGLDGRAHGRRAPRPRRTGHRRVRPAVRGWPALEGEWRPSLDRAAYVEGVAEVRRRIAAGHRLPGQPLPGPGARPARRRPGRRAPRLRGWRRATRPRTRRIDRPAGGRPRGGLRVTGGLPPAP